MKLITLFCYCLVLIGALLEVVAILALDILFSDITSSALGFSWETAIIIISLALSSLSFSVGLSAKSWLRIYEIQPKLVFILGLVLLLIGMVTGGWIWFGTILPEERLLVSSFAATLVFTGFLTAGISSISDDPMSLRI